MFSKDDAFKVLDEKGYETVIGDTKHLDVDYVIVTSVMNDDPRNHLISVDEVDTNGDYRRDRGLVGGESIEKCLEEGYIEETDEYP